MIRVGTRINVRPHARKKQVWGKVVLERVVVTLKMYFQKTQMTCYQKYREIKQQKLMVQQVRLFKRAIILG